ncbi:hypothetical protein KC352_g45 [Hortaea werneckii]|nr:hypothetical protein KC352_g45 [Hortaea werneckii]
MLKRRGGKLETICLNMIFKLLHRSRGNFDLHKAVAISTLLTLSRVVEPTPKNSHFFARAMLRRRLTRRDDADRRAEGPQSLKNATQETPNTMLSVAVIARVTSGASSLQDGLYSHRRRPNIGTHIDSSIKPARICAIGSKTVFPAWRICGDADTEPTSANLTNLTAKSQQKSVSRACSLDYVKIARRLDENHPAHY